MITKEQLTQWSAALKSGKFKQGGGFLCEIRNAEYQYCCLGVFAEINKLKKEPVSILWTNYYFYSPNSANKGNQYLPEEYAQDLGIPANFLLNSEGKNWFENETGIKYDSLAKFNDWYSDKENIFPIVAKFLDFLVENYDDFYKYVVKP